MESVAYEELLQRDGSVITHVVGSSMKPLLHDRQSIVVVEDAGKVPPKKGDVVLYKTNGTYILHRVMKITEKEYLTRGDNTWTIEHIPKEALLATMTQFCRKPEGRMIHRNHPANRLYRLALPCIRWTRRIGSAIKRRLITEKKE